MLTSMRLYTIMNQLVKDWSLLQAPLCDSTAGEPTQDQKVDEGNLESQHQTLAPPPPRPGSLPQGPWSHQSIVMSAVKVLLKGGFQVFTGLHKSSRE
ncbi:uncharacterized protein LOC126992401 isoform X2 [Eriocheir sinensis]|nr:uncharacterized protein LOC126992401 isoform X2 [Eriocheir sinensis]XP_050707090.1 uncharacterized protein LOC126992401 isoform X2 [Eriocheir sinensis]